MLPIVFHLTTINFVSNAGGLLDSIIVAILFYDGYEIMEPRQGFKTYYLEFKGLIMKF